MRKKGLQTVPLDGERGRGIVADTELERKLETGKGHELREEMREEGLGRLLHIRGRKLEMHPARRLCERVQRAPAVTIVNRDVARVLVEDARHMEVQRVHLAESVQARVEVGVMLRERALLHLHDDRAVFGRRLANRDERERSPEQHREPVAELLGELVDGLERLHLKAAELVVLLDHVEERQLPEALGVPFGQLREKALHEARVDDARVLQAPQVDRHRSQIEIGMEIPSSKIVPAPRKLEAQRLLVIHRVDDQFHSALLM